jgi:hypothetical protein
MVQILNLSELVVGPVGLWAKVRAVGNAQRYPRLEPVRRRRMVHKSTGRVWAPGRYRAHPFNSFTAGKELGWRDIDKHRPPLPQGSPADRLTENSLTPASSVD